MLDYILNLLFPDVASITKGITKLTKRLEAFQARAQKTAEKKLAELEFLEQAKIIARRELSQTEDEIERAKRAVAKFVDLVS